MAQASYPNHLDRVWTKANAGLRETVVWSDTKADGLPLKCTEHPQLPWCDDLKTVLEGNLDAEQLWNTGPGPTMLIPIMPTENVFESVTIVEVDGGDGMCEVFWDGADLPYDGDISATSPTFLGFFSPGQGRLALREMVVSQLEVEFASITQCNAPYHGVIAEREWTSNQQHTKKGFIDKYHVMKYGKCVRCFHHQRSTGTDDLIPESAESEAPAFWEIAKRGADQRSKEAEIRRLARASRTPMPRRPIPPPMKDPKDFTPVFSPVTKDDKTGEMF